MTSPHSGNTPEVANPVEESTVLDLEVVHGDLRLHDSAVIVGHLVGTSFDGAEWALDGASGGLLSHGDRLGVYAGDPGTVSLRRLTRRTGPPWAITIGMGEIGEFNASILRRGISEACLRLAVASFEADRDDLLSLTVAPVLIGVGTGGIRIEDSLSAMVNGVFDAKRRLRTAGLHDKVRIVKIEVIDIFEEVAIHTHRAAQDLCERFEPRPGEELHVAPFVRTGPGGRPGLPSPGYRDGAWQTVTVEAIEIAHSSSMDGSAASPPGRDEALIDLVFTAVGGRARVEEALSTTQRAQIDLLIEGAINTPEDTDQGHNTLYELLLPPSLKAGLEQPGNLMFVLDPEAAPYPWELLAPRMRGSEIEPLAAQAGLLRRLRTTQFRQAPRSGAGRTALVIGDPPSQLPPLPGAQDEANQVADLLEEEGWKVHRLISGGPEKIDANKVLNALFADDYRVIHIAAHGNYDAEHPLSSGVVIGDGRFLTSLEFAAMATVPEFVFLNCCYLANIDATPPGTQLAGAYGQFHRFAASVSQQLIQNGVRAITAAGWAVDDDAALQFARHLYGGLLHGVGYGDAVKHARSQVRKDNRGQNNTWGAYQCYGPPAFKLGYESHTIEAETIPASPGDLMARLRALVRRAETALDGDEAQAVDREVERLLDAVPDGFIGGDQLHTAGVVYLHLGETEKALEHLSKARRYLGVRASLSLSQHLVAANLTAAGDRLRADDAPAARTFMRQADEHLATIQHVIGDAEDAIVLRLAAECALRGALVKRYHSKDDSAAPAKAAIEAAEQAYRAVFNLGTQTGEGLDYRAGFDVFFCRAMLDLAPLEGDPPATELAEAAESQRSGEGWRVWAPAYQALAEAMSTGGTSFDGDTAAIRQLFADARERCHSRRERLAVRDHLEVLTAFTSGARSVALATLLNELFGYGDAPSGGSPDPAVLLQQPAHT